MPLPLIHPSTASAFAASAVLIVTAVIAATAISVSIAASAASDVPHLPPPPLLSFTAVYRCHSFSITGSGID
jgi:hypothetical protein